MKKSYQNILNNVARQHIPDEISLFPRIAAQLERKPFMQALHARPAISIIILVFALSLLSGVVYAVGHSLGYIPGIGIVEQDTPIRVLTQPVVAEQDGITLTVTDAVLSSEKSIVLYTLENVPWDILSHQEDEPGCFMMPFLRLPNGDTLTSSEGGGYQNQIRAVYPPIPAGVNEATFVLPCIMNSLPGLGPKNWELPLHFGPASPDMTIVPVIEITPTPAPEGLNELEAPVELNAALLIGDQYILTGIIKQPESGGHIELIKMQVTDADGTEVYTQMPALHDLPNFDWGMQFQAGT
ncbi:MAG: DUF4179 domain-containing protein, partial [Anaerolineaceae bacterium]|nr:DUF4179 domain-containing protein [Anaerolineaceae bacterium]